MSNPKQVYHKYCQGDPLTDDELIVGITHFKLMEELLLLSGPVFELARKEAGRVYTGLYSYQIERKRQ